MSSWDHSSAADEHTSYTYRQGIDQASPIESTYIDGSTHPDRCTYPDPTGFGRQTLPNDANTIPKSSHHYSPYFHTSGPKGNEVQSDDPFEGDEYWSNQSWDADHEQYLADLDPFSEATQISAIQSDPQCESQLSTGSVGQTREAFSYTASTFRHANTTAQSANTVASDSIYSVGYPFRYAPEYKSRTAVSPDQPFEDPFTYLPNGSTSYPADLTTRTALDAFNSSIPFEGPTYQTLDHRGVDKGNHESQSSGTKRKSQGRKPAAVAPALRRSHRTRLSRTTTTSAATTRGTNSVLGRKKAELGPAMGSDYRPRADVKVENGLLHGFVDNQWKPAGYHLDFRARLILRDAQQPGAPAPPVFPPGIPPNYTSYSLITQGWNDDNLTSMMDSQGRHAFLMPASPPDWVHNPPTGYVMCDGLVMLDHNNRPIKDYPGAPLTLSHDAPASLIEGLRRYFGMTYSDMTARMAPERYTTFTHHVFTPHATANYTGPLSNLTTLPAIQSALAASVSHVSSQHLLGTTVIDIHPNQVTANSTTYFQASLFGEPYSVGAGVYLYGFYADGLERGVEGWRVARRELVLKGPGTVGNGSLVGG